MTTLPPPPGVRPPPPPPPMLLLWAFVACKRERYIYVYCHCTAVINPLSRRFFCFGTEGKTSSHKTLKNCIFCLLSHIFHVCKTGLKRRKWNCRANKFPVLKQAVVFIFGQFCGKITIFLMCACDGIIVIAGFCSGGSSVRRSVRSNNRNKLNSSSNNNSNKLNSSSRSQTSSKLNPEIGC